MYIIISILLLYITTYIRCYIVVLFLVLHKIPMTLYTLPALFHTQIELVNSDLNEYDNCPCVVSTSTDRTWC